MSERVLVIPASKYSKMGVHHIHSQEVHDLVFGGYFMPRNLVEDDVRYKQIIPYSIFIHEKRILTYDRTQSSGEQRLVGMSSLGIGGHINPADSALVGYDTVLNAARREMYEEIGMNATQCSLFDLGVINADKSMVDKVHLGILFIWIVHPPLEVGVLEDALYNLQWMTRNALNNDKNEFETWSEMVIDFLNSGNEFIDAIFRIHK